MSLLADALAWVTVRPQPDTERAASNEPPAVRRLQGRRGVTGGKVGRQSSDSAASFVNTGLAALAPLSPPGIWRSNDLDRNTFDRMTPDQIIDLMIDVSPEISRAVWDLLRMVNPGSTVKVLSLTKTATTNTGGAQTPQEPVTDEAGQAVIDNFIGLLTDTYGAADVVYNKVIMGGIIAGGFLAEVVFDKDGRTPVDFVTPDPRTLRWKQIEDPRGIRGMVWHYGQYLEKEFVDLTDVLTVRYIPVDPAPGVPYGRSLLHPALFPTLFLLTLLRDLKRVVAQQGYPRLDIEVSIEKVAAMVGEIDTESGATVDAAQLTNAVNKVISEVCDLYAQLEPDDAYVHADDVTVNKPVGTVDSSSLGAVEGIIKSLERMIVRALKTVPLMMSISEGASEATANREWEVFAQGIKSLQHLVENLLGSLFGVVLRASGIQAQLEFRFAELRASEALRDAQTSALEILNEKAKYNAGWISQREACMAITGHEPDSEEPRMLAAPAPGSAAPGQANPATAQPEPGANRSGEAAVLRSIQSALLLLEPTRKPADQAIVDAEALWRALASDDMKGLIDAESED